MLPIIFVDCEEGSSECEIYVYRRRDVCRYSHGWGTYKIRYLLVFCRYNDGLAHQQLASEIRSQVCLETALNFPTEEVRIRKVNSSIHKSEAIRWT